MYTRLPLADEIRDARAAHAEAADARLLLQRVSTTRDAVDAVERQHARTDHSDTRIPGDDLIEELAERWGILADLPAVGPRSTAPFPQQLQARRTQLALADQVLRPMGREMSQRLDQLHTLQQRQRQRLDDPGYAGVLQQVQALSTRREAVIHVFQPLKQRLGIVDPTLKLLDNFIGQLAAGEDAGRTRPDPAGAIAWRTAHLAANFLASIEDVLGTVDFGVPTPARPQVPEQPSSDTVKVRWAEVSEALLGMRRLRDTIDERAADMRDRAQVAHDEYEQLSAKILDLTG